MIREGVENATLLEHDNLEAGNLVRHLLTIKEIDSNKAEGLATRLCLVNPYVHIDVKPCRFPRTTKEVQDLLEPFDLIIDCTGSDEVLAALSLGWWSMPKLFCSASLGLFGKRLFVFISDGNDFQINVMKASLQPWAKSEAKAWASEPETLEGAGCWSPLFPARFDDVMMAAACTVKEIEQASNGRLIHTNFIVYEQSNHDGSFHGLKRVSP
jgi:hypothetical protein